MATTTPADNELIANLPGDIRAVTATITTHTEATSAAHNASAISYGTGTVEAALDTAAGHEADHNNPHGVTAAQVGAVALEDAVTSVIPDKIVKRNSNGKVLGDITGNAVTATTATTATTAQSLTVEGYTITPSCDGADILFQVNSTTDVPVHNAVLLQGLTPAQIEAAVLTNTSIYTGSTHLTKTTPTWSFLGTGQGTNFHETQLTIGAGVQQGTYSLKNVIQSLINLSHCHNIIEREYIVNCNCS
jgi:hypothetical protein